MAQLHELFAQLDDEIKDENYENVIKIANRILAQQPDDADAFKVKLVCFINLEQYDQVVSSTRANKNRSTYLFEEAYALYRLKKLTEALDLLQSVNNQERRLLELKAQVFYSLERYPEASETYETILQVHGHSNDLITNLCAALVKSNDFAKSSQIVIKHQQYLKETFEFAYNAACAFIENSDYTSAEKYLDLALTICQTSLNKEGSTKEEIDDETAVIRAQQAYILQKKGNKDAALQLYSQLSEQNLSDVSVTAVVENNIISLRNAADRNESLKKLNQLRQDKAHNKLLLSQKQTLGFNHGLLLLELNKNDECRDLIQKLQKEYPTNDLLPLLNVSVLMKERKIQKAQTLLEEFADNHPQSSIRTQLSIAQIHLSQGNIPALISTLGKIESIKNAPATIATLVDLHLKNNDTNGAISVLEEGTKTVNKDSPCYPILLKKTADFKLSCGLYKEASLVYEQLLKINPNNLEVLPSLIIAYSYFNPDKARKLEGRLPSLGDDSIDPETLDNLAIPTFKRKERKKEDTSTVEKPKDKPKGKKTKKRKNKRPKNFDPSKPVDPERWIPKNQRTNFKGKRKGKGKDRGAQGSIAASQAVKAQEGKAQEIVTEGKIHVPEEDKTATATAPVVQSRRAKPIPTTKPSAPVKITPTVPTNEKTPETKAPATPKSAPTPTPTPTPTTTKSGSAPTTTKSAPEDKQAPKSATAATQNTKNTTENKTPATTTATQTTTKNTPENKTPAASTNKTTNKQAPKSTPQTTTKNTPENKTPATAPTPTAKPVEGKQTPRSAPTAQGTTSTPAAEMTPVPTTTAATTKPADGKQTPRAPQNKKGGAPENKTPATTAPTTTTTTQAEDQQQQKPADGKQQQKAPDSNKGSNAQNPKGAQNTKAQPTQTKAPATQNTKSTAETKKPTPTATPDTTSASLAPTADETESSTSTQKSTPQESKTPRSTTTAPTTTSQNTKTSQNKAPTTTTTTTAAAPKQQATRPATQNTKNVPKNSPASPRGPKT